MTAGKSRLAIDGGRPVRESLLPYGRQAVTEEDIAAVVETLRSDWLTTGPKVAEFEAALVACTGAAEAVAVSSGTAALHAAVYAAEIGAGDEVIVPAMSFAASANCVVYQGGIPVFADVDAESLLIDPSEIERLLTDRTRAVVAVDYAGQPCDYEAIAEICGGAGITVIADACHSIGATDKGRPSGSLADLSTFSFHPVKHVATGEGGAVTSDSDAFAARARSFRNHGISTDHHARARAGSWFYEMSDLGFNYRLTDIQCALGISQLARLGESVRRRREVAARYREAIDGIEAIDYLHTRPQVEHAYHLFPVLLGDELVERRPEIFAALRAEGIGVNVHYIPIHLHPYYRDMFGTREGLCPVAERSYQRLISLPMFAAMSDEDVEDVLAALRKVIDHYLPEASPGR